MIYYNIAHIVVVLVVLGSLCSASEHKFGTRDEIGDVEHLKHHLGDQIDIDDSKLSEEQKRFHYFKMHDLNKDNFIDGLELMAAIFHDDEKDNTFARGIPDTDIERLIDPVLEEMDGDKNGLIDFAEYFKIANV
ncbi:unnamed protein product [Bursaphelenchus okinawaensis]|uniref:EF-hand domain-containing protein n=1 Tax=Bursaphelenchus okinawaensis TaxID=465554 RepID=A0A811LF12_9BILA|nr:unnamed protein product [Bursaphelenchus okinawaensis]CAG9121832.1 unnamed protein product [Bursaphelenchus okinawaensis]